MRHYELKRIVLGGVERGSAPCPAPLEPTPGPRRRCRGWVLDAGVSVGLFTLLLGGVIAAYLLMSEREARVAGEALAHAGTTFRGLLTDNLHQLYQQTNSIRLGITTARHAGYAFTAVAAMNTTLRTLAGFTRDARASATHINGVTVRLLVQHAEREAFESAVSQALGRNMIILDRTVGIVTGNVTGLPYTVFPAPSRDMYFPSFTYSPDWAPPFMTDHVDTHGELLDVRDVGTVVTTTPVHSPDLRHSFMLTRVPMYRCGEMPRNSGFIGTIPPDLATRRAYFDGVVGLLINVTHMADAAIVRVLHHQHVTSRLLMDGVVMWSSHGNTTRPHRSRYLGVSGVDTQTWSIASHNWTLEMVATPSLLRLHRPGATQLMAVIGCIAAIAASASVGCFMHRRRRWHKTMRDAALRQERAHAAQNQRRFRELLQSTSHDMNTPIHAATAAAELLRMQLRARPIVLHDGSASALLPSMSLARDMSPPAAGIVLPPTSGVSASHRALAAAPSAAMAAAGLPYAPVASASMASSRLLPSLLPPTDVAASSALPALGFAPPPLPAIGQPLRTVQSAVLPLPASTLSTGLALPAVASPEPLPLRESTLVGSEALFPMPGLRTRGRISAPGSAVQEEEMSVNSPDLLLDVLDNSLAYLHTVIDNVLDLDYVDAQSVATTLREEPVDLAVAVEQTVRLLRCVSLDQRGVQVRSECISVPVVLCDRGRVMRILTNLLTNALKFTNRGHVEVRLVSQRPVAAPAAPRRGTFTRPALSRADSARFSRSATNTFTNFGPLPSARSSTESGDMDDAAAGLQYVSVKFEVLDTGRGMTEDELLHACEAYVHADYSAGGGSGLGLYICRSFVEAYNGTMTIYSTLGQGSCVQFTLVLPVAPVNIGEPSMPTLPPLTISSEPAPAALPGLPATASVPALATAAAAATPSASGMVNAAGRPVLLSSMQLRVLVVDSVAVHARMQSLLIQYMCMPPVTTASDGAEALAIMTSEDTPLDVVFMDLELSDMSAADAVRSLRSWESATLPPPSQRLPRNVNVARNDTADSAGSSSSGSRARPERRWRLFVCALVPTLGAARQLELQHLGFDHAIPKPCTFERVSSVLNMVVARRARNSGTPQ